MAKKPRFYFRKDQYKKVKKFKKRGFEEIDNQHNGIVLALIDYDGFRQKVVIGMQGQVQRYKPRKATIFEKQRLPKLTYPIVRESSL